MGRAFQSPLGNDKWGRSSLEMMLAFVSSPEEQTSQRDPQESVEPLNVDSELVTRHERDTARRKSLFLAYWRSSVVQN